MRRLLLTFIASVLCIGVHAQRFSFRTTVGTGFDLSTPASTPILWRVSGQYRIVERLSVGAGTGLSFYEKALIPVFAAVKFSITRPRKFTPFVECRTGYAFAPARYANGGFYLNPCFGVRYAVGQRHGIFVDVGYESQNLERLKTYENRYLKAQFAEKLRHRSIVVALGFEF